MLKPKEAIEIAKKNYPNGKPSLIVYHRNRYILRIDDNDPLEGEMDPYFSVHIYTGEFKGFSLIVDDPSGEVAQLLLNAKKRKEYRS